MKKIEPQPYPLITVTGTKGKTTIVRLFDYVYRNLKFHTLRVDTDGHFIDNEQKSTYFDARKYWGMVPNNCPGKYLLELQKEPFKTTRNYICLFEAAIGSSSLFGLGYANHDIGIFTNIYRDHITKVRIKNRGDIYRAKQFIFKRIKRGGFFIYNSSNRFLTQKLVKENILQTKIAVGYDCEKLTHFLSNNNYFFEIRKKNTALHLHTKKDVIKICNLKEIPFTFNGNFEPNLFNTAFVYAGLFAQMGKTTFLQNVTKITNIIQKYEVDPNGGRLVFIDKKDYKIIVDFAHETESFIQIAKLAKKITTNRVIGILRIDPSRIDSDIVDTAKKIWRYYDVLYIYDKVDGIKTSESIGVAEGKKRGIGESATMFAKNIIKYGHKNCSIIIKEDDALATATQQTKAGDVIVYIGDGYDHKKTVKKARLI